jgi:pimeloyl-ACP methyl ester carboxylesterase
MENSSPSSVGLATEIQEQFVNIGGARMRYLQSGSGPPLVLIHGLLGYSFSWRFTIPAVAHHSTVYAVDMLGTGFSDRPPDLDCCLQAAAQRVLQFTDAVGLKSFDLLGTSHGGGVAMMVAAACAQQPRPSVQRLILVAPINPWSAHGRRFAPFMGSLPMAAIFKVAMTSMSWTQRYWLARMYGDPRRIRAGTLEGYRAPYRKAEDYETGLKIARRWNQDMLDLESAIPRIANYPTFLMWGSRDSAVYASSAEPLRRVFRDCRVRIFDGVGHLPYEEVPDDFNRELIGFLTTTMSRVAE